MKDDLELALQIRDNLAATRRDLTYVAVVVHQGEVFLRGNVPSFYVRQIAVDRARRVPGVRHVLDEMNVLDGHDGNS